MTKSRFGLEPLKECDFSFIEDLVFRVHRKMETPVLSAKSDDSCKAIIEIICSHCFIVEDTNLFNIIYY